MPDTKKHDKRRRCETVHGLEESCRQISSEQGTRHSKRGEKRTVRIIRINRKNYAL